MFDPTFDPYAILEKLSEQQLTLNKNQEALSTALMEHKQFLERLTEAHNQNVTTIHALATDYKELHDRLILLEVARMYENTTNQTKN